MAVFRFVFSPLIALLCLTNVASAANLTFVAGEIPPLTFSETPDVMYVSGENVLGYTSDVVREIMEITGDEGKLQILPWARAYRQATSEPNVVIFSLARREAREELFNWVGPVATKAAVLFSRQNSRIEINDLDDARKLESIAALNKDSKMQYLEEMGFKNLTVLSGWRDAFAYLTRGRSDLLANTDLDGYSMMHEFNIDSSSLGIAFKMYTYDVYIGISKGTDEAIVKRWQAALDQLRQGDLLKELVDKWAKYFDAPFHLENGVLVTGATDQ